MISHIQIKAYIVKIEVKLAWDMYSSTCKLSVYTMIN